MPKKFPRRKDRQKLLEEFRKLGADVAAPQLFEIFAQSVNALDQSLQRLSEPDPVDGLVPDLKQEDKTRLMELYAKAGRAGEIYLAEMEKPNVKQSARATEVVSRLQALLARDYDALQGYDPARPRSVPELLEDSRTRIIDLRGRHIKPLGNQQNSRIPMTLKNAEGERRPGVFTKVNRVRIKERFDQILEQAKALCGAEGRQVLDNLLTTYRGFLIRAGEKGRDNQYYSENTPENVLIGSLIKELTPNPDDETKLSPEFIRDYFTGIGVDFTHIPGSAVKRLCSGLQSMVDTAYVEINGYNLQLADGTRLDSRNSAMSAMAGLLGASNLVARAEPMKFIDDNGQELEGTFMEYAEGLDLHGHPELCRHVHWDQSKSKKAQNSFKKSLADLQVVDFLCLNVDRHEGNLSFVVDQQGMITGVQAFDNDSSFGGRKATGRDAFKLRVISSSMKERLMQLTPEMLRFALRGHGLSNGELQAAASRLMILKELIHKKQISVVEDDRFYTLSGKDMQKQSYRNICSRALDYVEEMTSFLRQNEIPFVPYQKKAPGFSEVASTDRRFTMGGVQDAGDRVSRLIHDKDDGFKVGNLTNIRGSSKEFREMVAAAKAVVIQQKRLKELGVFQERQLAGDAAGAPGLERLDAAYTQLRTKVNAYFSRKMGQAQVAAPEQLRGKNEYEANRIKYAKNLMSAVKDYEEIRSGAYSEAQLEDREALLSQRRQRELRREKEELSKGAAVK